MHLIEITNNYQQHKEYLPIKVRGFPNPLEFALRF